MTNRLKEFEKLLGGFYLHNNYMLWVYFNPDADIGGQIVVNYINPNDIIVANAMYLEKDSCGDVQAFDDYLLGKVVKCELIDIDDEDFGSSLVYYLTQHRIVSDEALAENRRALVRNTKVLSFYAEGRKCDG